MSCANFFKQFRRQSADGLSFSFVVLWLVGDVFNVVGSIMQGVLPTMIALAIYYTLADVILLIQALMYNQKNAAFAAAGTGSGGVDPKHLSPATPLLEPSAETEEEDESWEDEEDIEGVAGPSPRRPLLEQPAKVSALTSFIFNTVMVAGVVLAGFFGWYLSSAYSHKHGGSGGDDGDDGVELQFDVLGQVFGYLCAVFYLGSRLPQIMLNFERKSCDGISFLFFLFACLGNLTYVISILALDMSPRYLLVNASWLLGSLGTLFLDGVIFVQFWVYNGIDEPEDYDSDYEDEDEEGSGYQAIQ